MALKGWERSRAYKLGKTNSKDEFNILLREISEDGTPDDIINITRWFERGISASSYERTRSHGIRRSARKTLRKRKIPAHLRSMTKRRKRA